MVSADQIFSNLNQQTLFIIVVIYIFSTIYNHQLVLNLLSTLSAFLSKSFKIYIYVKQFISNVVHGFNVRKKVLMCIYFQLDKNQNALDISHPTHR